MTTESEQTEWTVQGLLDLFDVAYGLLAPLVGGAPGVPKAGILYTGNCALPGVAVADSYVTTASDEFGDVTTWWISEGAYAASDCG